MNIEAEEGPEHRRRAMESKPDPAPARSHAISPLQMAGKVDPILDSPTTPQRTIVMRRSVAPTVELKETALKETAMPSRP
jgi:hypothetical protein